jgi:hypothetical protein
MNIEITQEITLDYDFDIKCENCGANLNAEVGRHGTITVTPCTYCLESEYNRGYDDGQEGSNE